MVSIGGYDVVLGEGERRREGFFRKLIGKAFNVLAHYFAHVPFWDMDTGFKVFKSDLWRDIGNGSGLLPYSPWTEFTISAYWEGFHITSIPVIHYPRYDGRSRNIQGFRRVAMEQLKGLYRVRSGHEDLRNWVPWMAGY
jgi:hypothetical protein